MTVDYELLFAFIVAMLFVAFSIVLFLIYRYYRKRLLAEVERAQKSERLKSVFLANVSHALRTPLNSIIGFSDLILKDDFKELKKEQVKEMLTHVNENGKHLLYFITQLLELSNYEGGMLTFSMIEVNLAELMTSYRREVLRDTNPNVSVQLKTPLSPHCKATLDTNLMHQLVLNLLMNAVQNTDEGTITMYYAKERNGLKVVISDTGRGVPNELKENIFSLLHNANTYSLATKDTPGLGLSICKSIISALHGEIELTSEAGKGTTVWFWFPCRLRDTNKFI